MSKLLLRTYGGTGILFTCETFGPNKLSKVLLIADHAAGVTDLKCEEGWEIGYEKLQPPPPPYFTIYPTFPDLARSTLEKIEMCCPMFSFNLSKTAPTVWPVKCVIG